MLEGFEPTAMDTTEDKEEEEKKEVPKSLEVETFLHLFTVIRLIDSQRYEQAAVCALALIEKVKSFLTLTLNPIAAKAYFYYSRAFELLGGQRYAAIRSVLLAAHITASLQHANEAQLTILNLLLRNYLHHSLFDQADKLASKSGRTAQMLQDGSVSNNQIARYLHYQGHIKAVQLSYGASFEYLEEALRKVRRTRKMSVIVIALFRHLVKRHSVFVCLLTNCSQSCSY